MKTFITLLATIVGLVSVKCDFKSLLENEYKNLTEREIRARVESDSIAECAITRAGHLGLRLQGLDYMVEVNEKKAQWVETFTPEVWPVLDSQDNDTLRHIDYISLGVSIGVDVAALENSTKATANRTVDVTDSEDILYEKYIQLKDNLLSYLETTIKESTGLKGSEFWAIGLRDHLVNKYKTFESDFNTSVSLNNTEIRAKTLQLLIEDMS